MITILPNPSTSSLGVNSWKMCRLQTENTEKFWVNFVKSLVPDKRRNATYTYYSAMYLILFDKFHNRLTGQFNPAWRLYSRPCRCVRKLRMSSYTITTKRKVKINAMLRNAWVGRSHRILTDKFSHQICINSYDCYWNILLKLSNSDI